MVVCVCKSLNFGHNNKSGMHSILILNQLIFRAQLFKIKDVVS